MTHDAARQSARRLGAYIKKRREEKGLSIRQLAGNAGIDSGGLTRIEHGQHATLPSLLILDRLARALDVPLIELLAKAGCDTSHDLHDCIRSRYDHLPEEAITAATAYAEQLAAEYGDPSRSITRRE